MTVLFIHYVCDWCDGLRGPDNVERCTHGWVIVPDGATLPSALVVFRSRADATRALGDHASGLGCHGTVSRVETRTWFTWIVRDLSDGSPARVTDRCFEVHADCGYPVYQGAHASHRAGLAPLPTVWV